MLAGASTKDGEGAIPAIADGRRTSGILVLETAVATVVDGSGHGSKTDNEGSGCQLYDG